MLSLPEIASTLNNRPTLQREKCRGERNGFSWYSIFGSMANMDRMAWFTTCTATANMQLFFVHHLDRHGQKNPNIIYFYFYKMIIAYSTKFILIILVSVQQAEQRIHIVPSLIK